MRVPTLALFWSWIPYVLQSTVMRSDGVWTCTNFSWESLRVFSLFLSLSTTLFLVWPELIIVDDSWRKLSRELTLVNSNPRLSKGFRIYHGNVLALYSCWQNYFCCALPGKTCTKSRFPESLKNFSQLEKKVTQIYTFKWHGGRPSQIKTTYRFSTLFIQ